MVEQRDLYLAICGLSNYVEQQDGWITSADSQNEASAEKAEGGLYPTELNN